MKLSLTYSNVVATLALFIALGGGAYAASSYVGGDGRITGCIAKNGNVRVVKAGKKCKKGERRLSWSQDGNPDAKTVGGFAANELARAGQGGDPTLGLFVTSSNATSVTVTAPKDGFLVVNGGVIARTATSACEPCYAYARATEGGSVSPLMAASVGNGQSVTSYASMPVSWVRKVEAGSHTVTLQTARYPEGLGVEFFNPTITAVFVPFGPTGATGL